MTLADELDAKPNIWLWPAIDVQFDFIFVFSFQLKGSEAADIDKEVSDMISLLHLEDKRTCQAKALSGGMKRKLCVGIALIAGSKVSDLNA